MSFFRDPPSEPVQAAKAVPEAVQAVTPTEPGPTSAAAPSIASTVTANQPLARIRTDNIKPDGEEQAVARFNLSFFSIALFVAYLVLTGLAHRDAFTQRTGTAFTGFLFPLVGGLGVALILAYATFMLFRRSKFAANAVFGLCMSFGVLVAGLQAFSSQILGGVLQDAVAGVDLPPEIKSQIQAQLQSQLKPKPDPTNSIFESPSPAAQPTPKPSSAVVKKPAAVPSAPVVRKAPTPANRPTANSTPTPTLPSATFTSPFQSALVTLATIPTPQLLESTVRNTRANIRNFTGHEAAALKALAQTQEDAGFLMVQRDEAVTAFLKAGGVRPETLLAHDHLAARSAQLNDLIEKQSDLLSFVREINALFGEGFVKESRTHSATLRPFPDTTIATAADVEQAQLDVLYALQSQLEVLRRHATRWYIDSATKRLKFFDESATQAYNTALIETTTALEAMKQSQAARSK